MSSHFYGAAELGNSKQFGSPSDLKKNSAGLEAGKVGTNSDKNDFFLEEVWPPSKGWAAERKPSQAYDEQMLVPWFQISVFFLNQSYILYFPWTMPVLQAFDIQCLLQF